MQTRPIRTMECPASEQGDYPADMPCWHCGRCLSKSKRVYEIHVIEGGSLVLHPGDEDLYEPDAADMGLQQLGPECRKRYGEFARPA